LLCYHFSDYKYNQNVLQRLYFVYGRQNTKIFDMTDICNKMGTDICHALLALQACTGKLRY